ncbi:MAG: CPBP family intramembrane metalloprotease [Bdellovibrionales bacterium]|nr:CPBP family intramembrane metalloprotease [Bdellovibrionales bacterium]
MTVPRPKPALVLLTPFYVLLGGKYLASALPPNAIWGIYTLTAVSIFFVQRENKPFEWKIESLAWGIPAGLIAAGAWALLAKSGSDSPRPFEAFVSYLVLTPVVEEMAFRGFLMPLFNRKWLAVLVSAVAFTLVHNDWLAALVTGAVYAGLYARRSRLLDCVVAHTATNALLALACVTTGRWTYWG